ncbi:uncharacterized protein RJT20DRAFT_136229 [Scheffersomyces xylosifermentans]|uniref:uncharacterized protein n=1 Tax=Scheffersomyces xylosifermentans TaxID=1304137 RepID=UPI00315D3BC3
MDNRKVYKSYRNKLRSISSTNTRGILSKVKEYFNTSNNNSNEDSTPKHASEQPSTSNTPVATPLDLSSLSGEGQNANNILSSFFREKGDRPLTDVEYEGVMSLMAKSKSNTPIKRLKLNDTSHFDQTDRTIALDRSYIPPTQPTIDDSMVFATPSAQKTLKKRNASTMHDQSSFIGTPDYTPAYHTFNDSFANRSVPSVKRVYQFSGLPSPYRTRIRATSASIRKVSKSGTKPKQDISTTFDHIPRTKYSNNNRPRSEAASTLLSILDGNNTTLSTEDKPPQNDLKRFANPYSSLPSIKRVKKVEENAEPAGKPSITAKDIANTIAYDKSKELPVAIDTRPLFPSSEVTDTASKEVESGKSELSTTTTLFSSSPAKSAAPLKKPAVESSNGFIFSANGNKHRNEPTVEKTNNGSQFSIPTTFTFDQTTKPVANLKNFSQSVFVDFPFPEVTPLEVVLDRAKVKQYEALFDF